MDDGQGRLTRMVAWNEPGQDITGMVARSDKVVSTCEKVSLRGEGEGERD